MSSKSKSLSNKPTKQNNLNRSESTRRKSTSNINLNINNENTSNTKQSIQNTQKFSCFDKFIKYLISFNKLEEATREKLRKENPKKNYSQNSYRINIPISILEKICLKTYQLLSKEPNLLKLSSPIYIFGDIHGQYCDLIRFIDIIGLPPKSQFLFLGDYVDRGDNSIEVISLLFSLKIKYPDQVFLLRGNHECSQVNDAYGFKDECIERYKDNVILIWKEINKTLRILPFSALIYN